MKNMYIESLEPKIEKCSVCGQKFPIPNYISDWGWKYNGKICCSYHCMRAAGVSDRKKGSFEEYYAPEKPDRVNRRRSQEEIRSIEDYLREKHSVHSAAIKFRRSLGFIQKVKKGMAADG